MIFHFWLTANKLTLFVGNAHGVLHVAFKESPWNIRRDIAVKVLCSANKVSFIIGRLQVTLFVANMRGVLRVDFDKIHSNGIPRHCREGIFFYK